MSSNMLSNFLASPPESLNKASVSFNSIFSLDNTSSFSIARLIKASKSDLLKALSV